MTADWVLAQDHTFIQLPIILWLYWQGMQVVLFAAICFCGRMERDNQQ